MNFILFGIILTSIIQLFVCHFSLWWIIAIIGRIMFSLRIVGATVKIKTCLILEGAALASMFLFNSLFSKGNIPWFRLGMFLLFGVVVSILEYLDSLLYVYVIAEDEDADNDYYDKMMRLQQKNSSKKKKSSKVSKTSKGKRKSKNKKRRTRNGSM